MSKEIQKAVADYLASLTCEPVPKGYWRIQDFAEKHGTGRRNVQIILTSLVKLKQAERRMFRVRTATGIQPVPHYKVSKEAAKAFGLT